MQIPPRSHAFFMWLIGLTLGMISGLRLSGSLDLLAHKCTRGCGRDSPTTPATCQKARLQATGAPLDSLLQSHKSLPFATSLLLSFLFCCVKIYPYPYIFSPACPSYDDLPPSYTVVPGSVLYPPLA